jgi:hypothetical protein
VQNFNFSLLRRIRMKSIAAISTNKVRWACGLLVACATIASSAGAQSAPRIRAAIEDSVSSQLPKSLHPLAQARFDAGRMSADTKLDGATLIFNRTSAQEADLKSLIAAQQNPASPLYHQWLTPDKFAARFGMADSDLEKVENWLQQQGFAIDSVARSKNAIHFSGTARQVEQAFSTEMHYYKVNGTQHFAPSTALSVPSAIAPTVEAVKNLDSFRPQSHAISMKNARVKPSLTQASTGYVFFAPGDIATAYDINPLTQSSITGSGQSITVVGQSAIVTSDLEAFQNAAGLAVKDPSQYLVPNSGTSATSAGDESESDLDLEWSNALAPGATINFVYTGNSQNYSAFDSLQYAVDQMIGTIISSSYGTCEVALDGTTLETTLEQGTSQGQTIVAAAGDDGSTDCYGITNLTTAQQEAQAVDYPASSPYVTGLGGTEISQANAIYLTPGDGYWEATTGSSDIVNSLEKYAPEVVWNDDTPNCGQTNCLSATGGGTSTLFTKPSWQAGVSGIPADGKRDVPDLALYGSPNYPGFVLCTSDTSFWSSGQAASCNSGFEDSTSGDITAAGGTSFDAPIFAGILALINQKQGYTTGQGLVNPILYTLAADSATYASAFHDITSGNNDCDAGSLDCGSSTAGFSAGTGYDQVSGLGSLDVNNLATAWPVSSTSPTLVATTTTITASSSTVNTGVSDNFTISVTAASGTPTGTVALVVDGGTAINETLENNGTYVYTTAFTAVGSHTILATYAGDSTYASSSSSVTVTVAAVSSGNGTISISATPSTLTVAQGSSGNETITVTPKSNYTGTVDLTFDTSNDTALQNLCYSFTTMNSAGDGTVSITGTAAVSTVLNLDANAADCSTTGAIAVSGKQPFRILHPTGAARKTARNTGDNPLPMTMAFAGLLLVGFLGRSSRKLRGLAALLLLATVGLVVSACGGVTTTATSNPPTGSYTVTVTGTDSITSTITTTPPATFTFVIN